MNKKILIYIAVGILFVILVALGVYGLFFGDAGQPAPADTGGVSTPEEVVGEAQQETSDGLLMLSASPVVGFGMVGGEIMTVSPEGTVQMLGAEGELLEEVSALGVARVSSASFDAKNTRAAVEIVEENGTTRWVLVENGNTATLGQNITSTAFSPEGLLAVVQETEEENQILLINETGEEDVLFTTRIPDLEITWADNRTLALTTTPSGFAPGILYLLDTNTQNLTRVLGNQYGLTALVSPQKDGVIYASTGLDGENIRTNYLSLPEQEGVTIGAPTLPEKCVFTQDTRFAFCATFTQSPQNATMPDDYYKGVFVTRNSNIVKINLETGSIETVAQNLPVDATQLQLSAQENMLFFINRNNSRLYRLSL